MKAQEYLRLKGKITNGCFGDRCAQCPLGKYNNGHGMSCKQFEAEYPEEAEAILSSYNQPIREGTSKNFIPTNAEYLANLLLDGLDSEGMPFRRIFTDDGFASYEAMVYYHIECPYYAGDKRCHCNNQDINRETCVECKMEWLGSEVPL